MLTLESNMSTVPATRHTTANGHPPSSKTSSGALTRQDLAQAIFDRCEGLSRREAKRIVDSVIEEMVQTLTSGESLKLHDFGSFVVRDKHERAGRNPRTGAAVSIESRRVVVFKASPNMKAAVNGERPLRPSAAVRRTDARRGDGAAEELS